MKNAKRYWTVVLQHLDMTIINSVFVHKKIDGTKQQLQFQKSIIVSLLMSDMQTSEDILPTSSKAFYHNEISDFFCLSNLFLVHILVTASKKILLESALFAIGEKPTT